MQSVPFIVIFLVFSCIFPTFISANENPEASSPAKITLMEVGVNSCEVRVYEDMLADEYWSYPAATASRKNSAGLPYGRKGVIHSIVLNPEYRPTADTKKEMLQHGKRLKDYYPPNSKGNPLGKLKMFIGFRDANSKLHNSSLGIHTTTKKSSVGTRASHGCVRQYDDDATEIAVVIMKQDGYSEKQIADFFEKARKNPHVPVKIPIHSGPTVVYAKK